MTIPTDDMIPQIAEVIVVEGRDDTAAIKRAVRAVTIETHGFGISKNTWDKIKNAHRDYGIIIFTDPDHAGEEIRRKILESFPDAKQAFLTREKATEKKVKSAASDSADDSETSSRKTNGARPDIGIENASAEDIREALRKARAGIVTKTPGRTSDGNTEEGPEKNACTFTVKDLDDAGLSGGEGAKERREKLGDILGIGYANAKGLLYKLNTLGIERKVFEDAVKTLKGK